MNSPIPLAYSSSSDGFLRDLTANFQRFKNSSEIRQKYKRSFFNPRKTVGKVQTAISVRISSEISEGIPTDFPRKVAVGNPSEISDGKICPSEISDCFPTASFPGKSVGIPSGISDGNLSLGKSVGNRVVFL
ncbi:unnamed protein product [Cochlearia groenlandica]